MLNAMLADAPLFALVCATLYVAGLLMTVVFELVDNRRFRRTDVATLAPMSDYETRMRAADARWSASCQLADTITTELAIDAASRRIASAYAR